MIRKFDQGYLISYLKPDGMMVTNLNRGARRDNTLCRRNNLIYDLGHPLLAPDIMTWWEDE